MRTISLLPSRRFKAGALGSLSLLLPGVVLVQDAPATSAAPGADAPSTTPPRDIDPVLKQQIEQLVDERLKKQKPVAGAQEGFSLQSADGSLRLRIRGYVQADGRFFTGRSGDTGTSSFLLRRVRPIFEGTVEKNIDFRIMSDFGGGSASVQDAYLEVRYRPESQIRFGKFKEPLSLERLQSGADLLFVERSLANNLSPNRDVGIQVGGDVSRGTVSYAIGVFNGVRNAGSADGDTNDDKDLAARLFLQPFRNQAASPWQGLGVGIAATWGKQNESLQPLSLQTAGRAPFFRYNQAAADAVTADGEHFRLAPQFYYYQGPFGLLGEYITSRQKVRKATSRDTLSHSAWLVQGSFVLTGEKASFRSVTPRRAYGSEDGGRGAVELAARFSAFSADPDTFSLGYADPAVAAEDVKEYTLGVNWYLSRAVKAQFNYSHTDFGRDLRFGSDRRDHEDAILTRFQISY